VGGGKKWCSYEGRERVWEIWGKKYERKNATNTSNKTRNLYPRYYLLEKEQPSPASKLVMMKKALTVPLLPNPPRLFRFNLHFGLDMPFLPLFSNRGYTILFLRLV